MPPLPLALCAALAATAPALAAQEITARPASADACLAIASNAQRLACYDAALGYVAPSPQEADLAADVAERAAEEAAGEQPATELFQRDLHPAARAAIANAGRGSLLDNRWELAKDSKLGIFQLRAYKPVYVLPGFWTSRTNTTPSSPNPNNTVTTPEQLDSIEAKFQLSFKTKVAEDLFGDNGDVWVGYTQSSRWQAYASETSRPFRETNYEPEVMLVFRNNYSLFGWKGRMTGISLNHQSNGRSDPFSRSWNRVILNLGLDRDNWAFVLRPWYRVGESARDDNNPDIEDYIGRGDALLVYNRNGHELSLTARHSLRGGDRAHGSLQLDWGFPINNLLRGHVQVFDGYGESMIDYNHKATYIGVGFALLEWF
ncbi:MULTISPECIES: phospholipase A [Pseudoxanthomonas]|uniref:Phospholipase A1 n=1 Tax=Pseudoxanthomonas taiwanensis J19 TaxID=935569 RepID=A0A562D815_9GAMM|nr:MULTISPECIES: phospholipase A [Pseudoxanthomonas]RRN80088.1 phospholipase [Pseudoxanthomonas sp. SGD-10]TWH05909.1 phospholipase A1 [Pseudoxanthomonas taiwanensis J19]